MNGPPRSTFSSFLSPEVPDEGPIRTTNIPRQRTKTRRHRRKRRRGLRAS